MSAAIIARKAARIEVNVHDFVDKELGKAVPYGVYDIAANAGWVSVGVDHDTAEFAVNAIRRWRELMGCERYGACDQLLITADGGGSNGSRVRLWKLELQKLADETGLTITVCHYPPGTSKWNKIEHRLFCHITQNWRGRPLTSRLAIVELIAATTTKTGLTVRCELDENSYAKGREGQRRRNARPQHHATTRSIPNGITPSRRVRPQPQNEAVISRHRLKRQRTNPCRLPSVLRRRTISRDAPQDR